MKTTASQGRFLAWIDLQGAKIKVARPKPVYYACARLAQDRARDGAVIGRQQDLRPLQLANRMLAAARQRLQPSPTPSSIAWFTTPTGSP